MKANKAAAKDQKPTATAPSAGSQPLPRDWQQIDVGQLVLAKSEGPWSSWWEAVPVEKVGDEFKLRWRDGVNKSPCTRARLDLALICPGRCVTANTAMARLSNETRASPWPADRSLTTDLPCGPFRLPHDLHLSCAARPAFRIPAETRPAARVTHSGDNHDYQDRTNPHTKRSTAPELQ